METDIYKFIHFLNRPVDRSGVEASLLRDIVEAITLDALASRLSKRYRGEVFEVMLNGYMMEVPVRVDEVYNLTMSSIQIGNITYRKLLLKYNFEILFTEIRSMVSDYSFNNDIAEVVTDVFINFPKPDLLEVNIKRYENAIRRKPSGDTYYKTNR